MSADIQQLTAIKTQTLARIAEITAAPKPTYDIDGQRVAWGEYLRQLQQTVDWCNEKLAGEAPFEFQTQAGS
jgi:DNA repair protein RadC